MGYGIVQIFVEYGIMNIALLGHVDAGKTTLARALTQVAI